MQAIVWNLITWFYNGRLTNLGVFLVAISSRLVTVLLIRRFKELTVIGATVTQRGVIIVDLGAGGERSGWALPQLTK